MSAYATGATTRPKARIAIPLLVGAYVFVVFDALLSDFPLRSVALASAVLGVAACIGFLVLGDRIINASAIVSFSIALFGGFGGIYTALSIHKSTDQDLYTSLLTAVTFLFILQISLLIWRARPRTAIEATRRRKAPVIVAQVTIGCVFFGSSLLSANFVDVQLRSQLAIIGILLIADGVLRKGSRAILILGGLAIVVLCYLYVVILFAGFGRLVLGMLACGMALLFSLHLRWLGTKVVLMAATIAALPILSASRLEYLGEVRGSTPLESEGLGSVVGPIESFAKIIRATQQNEIMLAWGDTYVNALTLWVPRALWPDKPVGFGLEIVSVTYPQFAGTPGFTDAATFGGEVVWNFGFWGLPLVIPVLVLALRALDMSIGRAQETSDRVSDVMNRILLVSMSAALVHFVWGGTNIYVGRTLIILLTIGVASLVASGSRRLSWHRAQAPDPTWAGGRRRRDLRKVSALRNSDLYYYASR